MKWFEDTLMPALGNGKCVIILDNAPYHNLKSKSSWYPQNSSKKAEIQEWLQKRGISFDEGDLKVNTFFLYSSSKIIWKTSKF